MYGLLGEMNVFFWLIVLISQSVADSTFYATKVGCLRTYIQVLNISLRLKLFFSSLMPRMG